MKRFLAVSLLLVASTVNAQVSYSTITGTVTDANSHPLANGLITATLVMMNGTPINGLSTPNGQPYNGSPVRGTLDANGFFSIGLVPNAILSQPGGKPITTQWIITISSPQDSAIVTYQPNWNASYQFTVAGNQDISSQLSALITTPVAYFNTKTGQSTIQASGTNPVGNQNSLQTKNGSVLGGGKGTLDPTTGNLSASVNSQLNVLMYGAKGDCSTDDTAAFDAAQTAAIAFAVGNSRPAALFLPVPSGGCYIVSNWFWKGVSLIGQASGLGPANPHQYNITLKSLPGYDVLHIPDPSQNTYTATFFPGAAWESISFMVDNSAAGVYRAHRWPGRWFDDGAMTSGSAVFASTNAHITCDDVGQAIQVNGAGASGANLVTTIQSVSPCWTPSTSSGNAQWQVVTLAASASTTVSNAHSYISLLGLPVTTNIGPCAIAFDLYDGNPAHSLATTFGGFNFLRMENVAFTATTGGFANGSCGIYNQGNANMYGWHVTDFGFFGLAYGIVSATTELNAVYQPDSGDFEKFDHGIFNSMQYPWINYNGFSNSVRHVQWAPVQAGMQLLSAGNIEFDAPDGWEIDLGMETPGSWSNYGHRMEGNGNSLYGDFTSGASGMVGYLGCVQCNVYGTLTNTQINNWGNTIISPNALTSSLVDNAGYANSAKSIYNGGGSPGSLPLPYWISPFVKKGSSDTLNRFTGDFLFDGNIGTIYNHDDLVIFPRDVVVNPVAGPYTAYYLKDTNAKTGTALIVSGSSPTSYYYALMQYQELGGSNPQSIVIGTNVPDTGGTFYMSARCASSTTFNWRVFAAALVNTSSACTTSYQQYSAHIHFTGSDIGQPLQFGGQTGTPTFYVEWAAFVPDRILNYPTLNTATINSPTINTASEISPAVTGSPTTPTDTPCNAHPTQPTSETYVANCGGAGAVNPGSGYAIPAYPSASTATVSPSNMTTDVTGNNLNIPGHVAIGSSPPTAACQNGGIDIHGCTAMSEGATSGTPTAGVDYYRADSATHQILFSLNGSAETALVGIGNIQITTGTTAIAANTCTTNTATSMPGVTTFSAIVPPTPTSSTTAVVGWGASGGLSFSYYVTANTFNWSVCNLTAASITPGASVTWNIGAR